MKKPPIPIPRGEDRAKWKLMNSLSGFGPHFILRKDGSIREVGFYHAAWWMERGHHVLFQTFLFDDTVKISTIFLTFDHNHMGRFFGCGRPHLFETMIFGNTVLDQSQIRYATLDEARLGHLEAVEMAKATGPKS